jgi:penicillin-binding protein 1C
MRFGRYNPENFEHNFHGPISAHQALRLSLNIPALRLAMDLTRPTLHEFLQKAGVRRLKPAHTYGISLVLGTAEVTMEELARLYMMLALDGILEPLVDHKIPVLDKKELPTLLLSPEASFITLDMLRNTPRPLSAQRTSEALPVYWKTGTSPGLRDAWAAGVFGPYVLVVWAGNFNNQMTPSLVGIRTAAPLFFSMIEALNQKNRIKDLIQKKSAHLKVSRIPVCIDSGNIGSECPSKIHTWYIPGISPIQKSSSYQRVLINRITGKRACRDEDHITAYQTFEVSSTDLLSTLKNAGIHKTNLPPWEKECSPYEKTPVAHGKNPIIHSPHAHTDYKVRFGEGTIPFMASAEGDVETLYWFVGRHYIGKTQPGEVLSWDPQPGRYRVRVVDNYGRSTTTSLLISQRK